MPPESHNLRCWRCGASLARLSLPLSRLDECPDCAISLHVCRLCQHYDAAVAEQCRHDDAEYVKEKERPNFCDFFSPSETAYGGDGGAGERSRAQLDALFGDAPESSESNDDRFDALNDLFKKD